MFEDIEKALTIMLLAIGVKLDGEDFVYVLRKSAYFSMLKRKHEDYAFCY